MDRNASAGTKAPPGWHTITPRIVVANAAALVEFVRHVFGASGDYRVDGPSVLVIGDSPVMVNDAGERHAMPAFLYVYVDDVEGTYRRALDRGARTMEEPRDTPYGDRRAMVSDSWGNTWQIARPLR